MSAQGEVEVIYVLVVGAAGSGKSGMLQAICGETRTRPGWHTGQIQLTDDMDARFMEPEQPDFMWLRGVIENAYLHGCMVVCDSSNPDSFGESLAILQLVNDIHPGIPCVFVANKQDHPQAWSAEDVRMGLGIPEMIPVMPSSVRKRKQIRKVLVSLFNQIFA